MVSMKILKKKMTKNYKIIAKFIKDMSSETPDVETYMYVKDHISQYQLGIDINSKAIKSRLIDYKKESLIDVLSLIWNKWKKQVCILE